MKKNILLITTLLFSATFEVYAEDYYWLVSKTGKITSENISTLPSLMGKITKNSVIVVSVDFTADLCDFEKSVVTHTDSNGRLVTVCSYIGHVRKGKVN